ncbi:hypothetical protein EB796_016510 [Bugula neritina]|uniref:Uncharacterized protein n=1 Tax=Bugula neritina TaxID=10212 RepID=A0A7J7JFX5_BUGNE|nr:hypothetical protein EB796_016510 [Bugula neritina]
MKSDLIKTILELEQRQIITKVEAPTDWISHLQPVLGKFEQEYRIELRPEAVPVQVRLRKVPLSMKSDLIKTILELEQRQIITKVEAPTDWISHLQPVLGKFEQEYKIELRPEAVPVQVRPRKVPFSMKSDLIKTILELEQRQIITKVEAPTDWISHLQPVLGKFEQEYKIELRPEAVPVQVRPRKVPLSMKSDLIKTILELEQRQIITKTHTLTLPTINNYQNTFFTLTLKIMMLLFVTT